MFVFIKKTPDRFVCMLEIELKFLAGFSHFPVILRGAHIGMQAATFFFFWLCTVVANGAIVLG